MTAEKNFIFFSKKSPEKSRIDIKYTVCEYYTARSTSPVTKQGRPCSFSSEEHAGFAFVAFGEFNVFPEITHPACRSTSIRPKRLTNRVISITNLWQNHLVADHKCWQADRQSIFLRRHYRLRYIIYDSHAAFQFLAWEHMSNGNPVVLSS